MIRTFLYNRLRRGIYGGQLLYRLGAYLYWLARARCIYVGTRIVEVPWALKRLATYASDKARVLQVGDVILKDSLGGCDAELVDMDAEEQPRLGLKVYKADIRTISLPDGYFDVALSISTIEHIGIHGLRFPDGDKLAVDIIARALRVGGIFLFSVPFGDVPLQKNFRVYQKERLTYILGDRFTVEEEQFLVWQRCGWRRAPCEVAEIIGLLHDQPGMNRGVALVVARKTH